MRFAAVHLRVSGRGRDLSHRRTIPQRSRRPADPPRSDLFKKVYVGLFDPDGTVGFFDVEEAPPRNQPPSTTLGLAQLVEAMRGSIVVRNEGVLPEMRYAANDPGWVPPAGSLPDGLDTEGTARFRGGCRPRGRRRHKRRLKRSAAAPALPSLRSSPRIFV